ncbi:MAG: hypothetical protein BGN97_11060 [Microbacterium sp. 69-10]|uniref:Lrp/AsnC family transcriptional regulator n=1 Tax=Microbacterium sp. 69-10 TaxID=1895783 RepID=UPI000968AC09|nr:Lrp/AsnC family transcriptional regulator [Microbacterium sp. 69-10]OJU40381.1 MAG: hypothetical protein BGN97_11060 [Microbacterium sp. 69-10]
MTFDDEDRRIAAGLLVHPRAGWPLLSETLGIPLSTVARRGKQLIDDGHVRVIGNIDVMAAHTGFPVLLRVECEQASTDAVATELAARVSMRGVTTTAGSFQVHADVIVSSLDELSTLIVGDLPRTPGIRNLSTHIVLRRFTTAHSWDSGILTRSQVDRLRQARPDAGTADGEARRMDDTDVALIRALEDDGRATWRELAAHAGVEQRTAQRRILDLMTRGMLRMRTFVRPADIGLPLTATLWIGIDPAKLESVGLQLAQHPAVTLLVATTGSFNLCGSVAVADNRALYDFMTVMLGRIPGMRQIDVAVEMTTLKRMDIMHPYNERSMP